MIINLSNHPSATWDNYQKEAAGKYGQIIDIEFPIIPAQIDEEEVENLANDYAEKVTKYNPEAVMVQGEYSFTYRLVNKLKEFGITCISACSERMTTIEANPDGSCQKTSVFRFVKFREY